MALSLIWEELKRARKAGVPESYLVSRWLSGSAARSAVLAIAALCLRYRRSTKRMRMRMRSARLRVAVLQASKPIKDKAIQGHEGQGIRKSSSSEGYFSAQAIIRAGVSDPSVVDGCLRRMTDIAGSAQTPRRLHLWIVSTHHVAGNETRIRR